MAFNRITLVAAAFFITFAVATAAHAKSSKKSAPWMVSVSSNYGKWETGDLDSDGSQTLVFTQISYDANNWGAAVTGTYANTSYKPSHGEQRLDISVLTDTDISSYYSLKKKNWNIRFGLDLRLPTGKHSYSDKELSKLITDDISQDLMLLNSYGGGTNLTPHFLIVRKFDKFTLGLGGKYDISGEYDPTEDTPDDNLDPGDQLLIIVNGLYTVSANDYFMFSLTYVNVGKDKQTGEDIFHQGDTYSGEIRYLKRWSALTLVGAASLKTQEKNKLISDGEILKSEISNSNNNIAEFYLNGVYKHSRKISFTALLGYKEVGSNGYGQEDDLYDAGRSKIYFEPGISWHFSSSMYATGKIRYSNIKDKSDASSAKDATYDVYSVDLSFVYSF